MIPANAVEWATQRSGRPNKPGISSRTTSPVSFSLMETSWSCQTYDIRKSHVLVRDNLEFESPPQRSFAGSSAIQTGHAARISTDRMRGPQSSIITPPADIAHRRTDIWAILRANR
ncbi:hypothetical protein JMJ77_0002505 [Colletotrichum scovillei]|uniref:Uncharacterized protein n=1 Tax=Colletotrichum scovillei TaxID=1209932 RepID=A0A9P7R9R2_9PEZI|nr:hypothetical protein JMJ77_0002505 [Colletotrichum scovillei]KAG7070926.1 hypothetical protein JMJ76_0002168 [Colletotrichum scovillei]KAG7079206.1 hypothetical protein JMJ78_0002863 [Colletotrichum scovillei]